MTRCFGLLLCLFCTGCPILQDLQNTPDRGLATDLIYLRTGGIGGFSDQVRASPDGTLRATGSIYGDQTRTLTVDELDQLAELVSDWGALEVSGVSQGCADAFSYTVTYAGKTLSWDDCTLGVPAQLDQIAQRLDELVRGDRR